MIPNNVCPKSIVKDSAVYCNGVIYFYMERSYLYLPEDIKRTSVIGFDIKTILYTKAVWTDDVSFYDSFDCIGRSVSLVVCSNTLYIILLRWRSSEMAVLHILKASGPDSAGEFEVEEVDHKTSKWNYNVTTWFSVKIRGKDYLGCSRGQSANNCVQSSMLL